MIADIFYPIFTLRITALVCFIQKKKTQTNNCLSALHPRLQQGITLDSLGSLQLPLDPELQSYLIWLLQKPMHPYFFCIIPCMYMCMYVYVYVCMYICYAP